MKKEQAKRYRNSSLEKSLRVLWLFDAETGDLTLTEIARGIGTSPGGVTPIVQTLLDYRFLERDETTKRYRLGLGILERANYVLAALDIRDAARPTLRRLAHELQVNAHLAVRYEKEVLYVHREEASSAVVFRSIIGRRAPLHCTALGKVFLAEEPDLLASILETPLLASTPKTLTTPLALKREIGETANRGIAFDDEEFHIGQICFAAPVRDFSGQAVAAVSISVPKGRLETEKKESFEAEVVSAAGQISSALGHTQ